MKNNKTKKLAISSVFVAISVIICVVASVFSTMSLAITAIAGICSVIVLLECGYRYSLMTYIASSILVLLLVPDKECAVYYFILFGHYPITKLFAERSGKRVLGWMIKIVIANVLYYILFLITTYLLVGDNVVGMAEKIISALLFNIAFVLYDICLGKMAFIYTLKRVRRNGFR